MEEKGVPSLDLIVSKVNDDDSLCAMYLGISCAFFALKSLAERESASANQRCAKTRDPRLVGSAQLLGLIGWRVHTERAKGLEKFDLLCKLQAAKREINELKRRRSEDAKANEKVVSIYAVQKQSWFTERRKLQQQIGGLLNDLRVLNKRKSETISDLNGELKDMEVLLKSKDKMLEDEEKKRKELEERAKREAEDHSSELLKHKTAVIELVSNQRQLEAELGRVRRQVEAARQQLDLVCKEKEEAGLMVQELYTELEKMHRDSEHKDKILSAMARKSKLELPKKQMLLHEVKLNKPNRKKAGRETERWWTISGSRNARCTLRNLLSRQVGSRLEVDKVESDQNEKVDVALDAEVCIQNEDYSLNSTVLPSLETIQVKGDLVKDNLAETTGKEVATRLSLNKTDKAMWKMDLHALGVSYKIKRLNQQLLVLERLTGKQESVAVIGKDEHGRTRMKGFLLLLSLVDKQFNRYKSLQEKIDDLSQRMGEKDLHVTQVVPSSMRTKEDTRALEHFLEETFQLQRFIVATGQKLMEIQTKIDPGFVGISEELDLSASFDMRRFAETIRTLFKDIQRGLEVRIARIIGDLEGTLACDGIHSWKQ